MPMLPGWCIKCHKVKRVQVAVPRPGDLNIGVCAECEDAKRPRRNH